MPPSHNPAPINGLKWMVGPWPANEKGVQSLQEQTESPATDSTRSAGTVIDLDVDRPYTQWLKETFGQDTSADSAAPAD